MTTVAEAIAFLESRGRRFNKNHGKDGKFTSGSGGGGGGAVPTLKKKGIGSTKDDADAGDVIHDPVEAAHALGNGQYVKLDKLSLGSATEVMAGLPKAAVYDMSHIRMKGNEQAFEGLGMPRGPDDEYIATGGKSGWGGMPQIESQYIPDYVADLRKRGVKVDETAIDPTKLKASQSQLDAQKAGGIKKAGRYKVPPGDPILVTSDGYVVDGHHRWAAAYAANESVPAIVIDMPIHQGLADATAFMLAGHGEVKVFGGK